MSNNTPLPQSPQEDGSKDHLDHSQEQLNQLVNMFAPPQDVDDNSNIFDKDPSTRGLPQLTKVPCTEPIHVLMENKMFSVHGVPLCTSDFVRIVMNTSSTFWETCLTGRLGYEPGANAIFLSVNLKDRSILGTLLKVNIQARPDRINTCTFFPETGCYCFALSRGYILDHALLRDEIEPNPDLDNKYLLQETGDIYLSYKDLCDIVPKPIITPEKQDYAIRVRNKR